MELLSFVLIPDHFHLLLRTPGPTCPGACSTSSPATPFCRLARELTPATLRELSAAFGLTHPDSVRNLIRRVDRALPGSPALCAEVQAIRRRLLKTEKRP